MDWQQDGGIIPIQCQLYLLQLVAVVTEPYNVCSAGSYTTSRCSPVLLCSVGERQKPRVDWGSGWGINACKLLVVRILRYKWPMTVSEAGQN